MRCPACGFENIPGLQKCSVCSSALDGRTSPRDVTPPRARDRSLRSRLAWEAHRAGLSRLPLPAPSSLKRSMLVAVSLFPGAGVWLSPNGRRIAWIHNAVMLALAVAGAAFIRTPLSDVLFLGVFGLWSWSVAEGLDVIFPANTNADLPLRRIGLVLIAAAALSGGYAAGRLALSPVIWTMRVLQPVQSRIVSRHDSVLIRRLRGAPRRGDLVAARTGNPQYPSLFGPVIGVPGDRLIIGPTVVVNGRPTIASIPAEGAAQLTLGEDEYWVRPFWRGAAGEGRGAAAGVVRRQDIRGRAVAIVFPRHRRARIHSENIYARED